MTRKTLELMGRKKGMTQVFDESGHLIPCTIIEIEPNVLTAILNKETNGYNAVQLGYEKCSESKLSKPVRGHFQKQQVSPRRHLAETRVDDLQQYTIGEEVGVDYFADVPFVDITSISKGKGFQGTMKKYNYGGGRASHGCSRYHRGSGSTGMRSTPGRCFPGGKRASRMGFDQKTVQNLKIVKIIQDDNILLVKGSVPGHTNSIVTIASAIKKS